MILFEIDTFNDEEIFDRDQNMYSHFMYNNEHSVYLAMHEQRFLRITIKNLFEQTNTYKFFRI